MDKSWITLDEILLVQNESGKFEKYEPYAEIVCNTEAEFEKINEAMRQYQGWIDINDRLPDPEEYVLVSFENFTLPDIGRYEAESDGSGAFYPGDEDASYVSFGVFVNAWMPLPKVYRREETES